MMRVAEMTLEKAQRMYRMRRLSDDEFLAATGNIIATIDSGALPLELRWLQSAQERYIYLARVEAALAALAGESGGLWQDWNGTFAFPFLLERDGEPGNSFLLLVHDRDSQVWVEIARLRDEAEQGDAWELHWLLAETHIQLALLAERTSSTLGSLSFARRRDAEQVIFGYAGGQFFERHYSSPAEYIRAVRRLNLEL